MEKEGEGSGGKGWFSFFLRHTLHRFQSLSWWYIFVYMRDRALCRGLNLGLEQVCDMVGVIIIGMEGVGGGEKKKRAVWLTGTEKG